MDRNWEDKLYKDLEIANWIIIAICLVKFYENLWCNQKWINDAINFEFWWKNVRFDYPTAWNLKYENSVRLNWLIRL